MKVLVLGNSQAGALKRAHDGNPERLTDAGIDIGFFVIPGGLGPDLTVVDDHLVTGHTSPTHPPYLAPKGIDRAALSSFDAIIISALGFFNAGYGYASAVPASGALAQFKPRGVGLRQPLVSDRCMKEMAAAMFERQAGVRTLRVLASSGIPILVQSWPRVSDDMLNQPEWGFRKWYTKPKAAYQFFARICDENLATIEQQTGAQILPRPEFGNAHGMTPAAFMREIDGVHQSDQYGCFVLDIIKAQLTNGTDAALAAADQTSIFAI
jgi:hypothetical protein